jgi:hypothetical protein
MRHARPTLRTVMVPVAPPGTVAPRPMDTAHTLACDSCAKTGDAGAPAVSIAAPAAITSAHRRADGVTR